MEETMRELEKLNLKGATIIEHRAGNENVAGRIKRHGVDKNSSFSVY